MIKQEDCEHDKLTFGSGDYYLFCYECGAAWAMIAGAGDYCAPEQSNKGVGMRLSGVTRNK